MFIHKLFTLFTKFQLKTGNEIFNKNLLPATFFSLRAALILFRNIVMLA